ncbi:MAG: helix-turn-helix transcriptional regulator [Clostridia bacterium]|nr:helix-turn-helix transcriptional regulator [Clostridia bacterium]
MQVNIGQKIRELRLRDNRTQAETAEALGVSPQAVSRWEMGTTYPDLELLPAIAGYFGTSIDGLFGFQSERESKIDAILSQVNQNTDVDERLALLRSAVIEFPGDERILYQLAAVLSEAGWQHLHEHIDYNEDGYLVHDVGKHRENPYWNESVKLFERLLTDVRDPEILHDAVYSLTLLYCNLGQYEKGLALAERMPPLRYSREIMRSYAVDGAEKHRYEGESLVELANEFANQMVYTLMSRRSLFDSDLPVRMLSGTVGLLELLFEDGNLGGFHAVVCEFLMYLSEHQWRCGMRDEAFASLDKAADHAEKFNTLYDALQNEDNPTFTAPLLSSVPMRKERWVYGKIAPDLAEHWPVWTAPDYEDVYAEITADPRWKTWVERTKKL